MTTLTIKIPDSAKTKLSELLKELGGEVVTKTAKSKSELQKESELLKQIKLGLKDVADIKSGKVRRISLSEGLRG